jgi:hypothetical protein
MVICWLSRPCGVRACWRGREPILQESGARLDCHGAHLHLQVQVSVTHGTCGVDISLSRNRVKNGFRYYRI